MNCVRADSSVYEESTQTEMASFPVYRILFCAVGSAESEEENCFGFTCSRGEAQDTAIFQCHVFKCSTARAVSDTGMAGRMCIPKELHPLSD